MRLKEQEMNGKIRRNFKCVNKVKILPSVYFPFHFPAARSLSSAALWLDEEISKRKDIFRGDES